MKYYFPVWPISIGRNLAVILDACDLSFVESLILLTIFYITNQIKLLHNNQLKVVPCRIQHQLK